MNYRKLEVYSRLLKFVKQLEKSNEGRRNILYSFLLLGMDEYKDQYTDLRYLEGVKGVGFPTENFQEWREKFIEKICDFPDKVSVCILYVLLSRYE